MCAYTTLCACFPAGIPADKFALYYAGQKLEEQANLAAYSQTGGCNGHGICEGCTVYQVLHTCEATQGVSCPVGIGQPLLAARPWNRTASVPQWHMAKPGLCIEGYCNNTACEAHGQRVIHNAGFGHFDIILQKSSSGCKCPCCNHSIKPFTAAFNNCEWKYIGLKRIIPAPDGKLTKRVTKEWKATGNVYQIFSSNLSTKVLWTRLLIITRQPRLSSDSTSSSAGAAGRTSSSRRGTGPLRALRRGEGLLQRLLPDRTAAGAPQECGVCCGELVLQHGGDMVVTRCGHYFHCECLSSWLKLGSSTCPNCSRHVAHTAGGQGWCCWAG